jgi:glycosyltransferase involved in cell wall biosynthesis
MNIGFDAKRAYHNQTGLGQYSRTLIHSLAKYYCDNDYFLFNPKASSLFHFNEGNVHEVLPHRFPSTIFPSAWRGSWIKRDLKKLKIDIYHGLSHEIPIAIKEIGIKSVVTIHDLIYERFPEQYNPIDVKIYRRKIRFACQNADVVVAISKQTKNDIIQFYEIPENKIVICYQSCNPAFGIEVSESQKKTVQIKYGLPEKFFLHVGSIIERKNLLNICKAIFLLRNELDIPLVVIGDGSKYKQQVKDFVNQNDLKEKVIFLSESSSAKSSVTFQTAEDFPAIYQSAVAMVYPSFFEGFGIPVLEAMWSKLPVLTSNVSCLPEVGNDAVYYVDPQNTQEIAAGMKRIFIDHQLAEEMKEKGRYHAQNFTQQKSAEAMMKVYEKFIS